MIKKCSWITGVGGRKEKSQLYYWNVVLDCISWLIRPKNVVVRKIPLYFSNCISWPYFLIVLTSKWGWIAGGVVSRNGPIISARSNDGGSDQTSSPSDLDKWELFLQLNKFFLLVSFPTLLRYTRVLISIFPFPDLHDMCEQSSRWLTIVFMLKYFLSRGKHCK